MKIYEFLASPIFTLGLSPINDKKIERECMNHGIKYKAIISWKYDSSTEKITIYIEE